MMANSIEYKYSRFLETLSLEEKNLFVAVANVRKIKVLKDKNGEVIDEKIQTGPSYSIESNEPFDNLENNVYELTLSEFDHLMQLYQTDKEAFIKYIK